MWPSPGKRPLEGIDHAVLIMQTVTPFAALLFRNPLVDVR
jgi:hypothetical protein